MESLNSLLQKTKIASKELAKLSEEKKNEALIKIADNLLVNADYIISENNKDLENGVKNGLSNAMIDRLRLTIDRLTSISNDIKKVASLDSVIGEVIETYNRPNGLVIRKVRVPFGVICAIFESRPNVSVDIACLSLKTSNACILRGGKEAINSNIALVKVMKESIKDIVNPDSITLIEDTDRRLVTELIEAKEYVDLVVPRGGKALIQNIVMNSKVPFIETGAGNCHLYINKDCDVEMAIKIAVNAKVSRPAVCNAIETILVDDEIKEEILKRIKEEFDKYNVVIKGCNKTKEVIKCEEATEEDFFTEYDDYVVSIKVVSDVNEAIKHIDKYSTKHSETIVSNNKEAVEKFLNEVDSSCVYVNASTRFTDGGEFGFGAELGISTQKLHARGPMGLREMTTYKYKIYGEGQVR